MAQAAKSSDSKAAKNDSKGRSGRPPAVDFDFSNVSVSEAPAPVRKTAGAFTPPPAILAALRDSWTNRTLSSSRPDGNGGRVNTYIGSGKSLTVPSEAATTVVGVIRRSATTLELGTAVSTEDNGKGQTQITFAAKTPKQRKAQPAS